MSVVSSACEIAIDPPGKIVFDHVIPVVNRIAPELTGSAEIIGRHSGNYSRRAGFVEFEIFGMAPDIRGIVSNKNRHVTDDAYLFLSAVSFESGVLFEKQILNKFFCFDAFPVQVGKQ